ncbi:MAG TPA: arsenic transporter [Acidobacteriaceae bacterium]|nr:arsenic transporter [Acidobacteriaceae bacterium]
MVNVSSLLILAISALSILLMLWRPKEIPEVAWVGSGALLLVVFHLIPLKLAGKAVGEGTDVYLFLTGMMLLSELARANGVFDWVSTTAVRHSNNRIARLFTLIYGIGTIVTVAMSNDATAVVLTPAVLAAVNKAKVKPLPALFACAMIANAASFVLPISNPANLVVFHTGMPPLGRWLLTYFLPSLLSVGTTYLVLRFLFRKELAGAIESQPDEAPLSLDGKVVLGGLALVVATLLTASAFNQDLGLPTCLAALVVTAVLCIKQRCSPLGLAKEISWLTLLLVAALFVIVDALESIGLLHYTQAALAWVQHLPAVAGTLLTGFAVGVTNNFVNNLPLGLVAGATVQSAHLKGVLTDAVLIGVDLGPNLSVTGSLATILWLLALRKENQNVNAWDFLKVGLLAMPAALLASLFGLLVMHAITGS